MQELLRRDYAVGYIMLGWLLRCTWALTPGIALLLKLPEPAMARSARQQLPALLAWLLFGRGGSGNAHDNSSSSGQHHQAEQQKALLQQLSPVALKGLQEQLVGPTAALASIASFSKTYQLLANAPVTAQQVRLSLFCYCLCRQALLQHSRPHLWCSSACRPCGTQQLTVQTKAD
jgi:hypothetical protein